MIFEKTSRQGSIVAWARKSLCSGAEKDHALTCKYQAVGTLHNQRTHFFMRNKIATRICVSWTWQSVKYIGPFSLFPRPFRGFIKLLIIPTVKKIFFPDGPIFFFEQVSIRISENVVVPFSWNTCFLLTKQLPIMWIFPYLFTLYRTCQKLLSGVFRIWFLGRMIFR